MGVAEERKRLPRRVNHATRWCTLHGHGDRGRECTEHQTDPQSH